MPRAAGEFADLIPWKWTDTAGLAAAMVLPTVGVLRAFLVLR
jgi:hypothetical protein